MSGRATINLSTFRLAARPEHTDLRGITTRLPTSQFAGDERRKSGPASDSGNLRTQPFLAQLDLSGADI